MAATASLAAAVEALRAIDSESQHCADCGDPDPSWASVNLGVLICTACSGVHRSFGVHVSMVQSLTLDTWSDSHIETFADHARGHAAHNSDFEFAVPDDMPRPIAQCPRTHRERYLEAKYVERSFHCDNHSGAERHPPREMTSAEQLEFSRADASLERVGAVDFLGVLHITLKSGKNIEKKDLMGLGKSDPYAVFTLGSQSVKSRRIDDAVNPVWNESLMLCWDGLSQLRVHLFDWDLLTPDDPLGDATIDLDICRDGEPHELDLALEHCKHGSLQLLLLFSPLDH